MLAIGPMLSMGCVAAMREDRELVSERHSQKDAKLSLLEFAMQEVCTGGGGSDWHTSAKARRMADVLVAAFRSALSW